MDDDSSGSWKVAFVANARCVWGSHIEPLREGLVKAVECHSGEAGARVGVWLTRCSRALGALVIASIVQVGAGCKRESSPPVAPQVASQTAASASSLNASVTAPSAVSGVALPDDANLEASTRSSPSAAAPEATATSAANTTHQDLPAASGQVRELTWTFQVPQVGAMDVLVVVPAFASDTRRLPVLVTMHGLGESRKGPKRGARGWVDDYWLTKALERLTKPPLTTADFRDRVDPKRLERINATLVAQPYHGLIVVCPYTPMELLQGEHGFTDASVLASFVVDKLLPKVYAETPAIGTAATTGVDGVSLGGRGAVLTGLTRAESFGVVGGLQPAFDSSEVAGLVTQALSARQRHPGLVIRLLSSSQDYYLKPTKAISAAFTKAGVNNYLNVVAGDHSYEFNRGPGVYEMLLLHDRALRGKSYGLDGSP